MRPAKTGAGVKRARRLRAQLNKPEAMLWQQLRGSPCGVRFRRQHPAGSYVLDFFCARANLGIEVDGFAHDTGDRPQRDVERDHWLAEHRIETIRIPAKDVLRDAQAVAESLVALALARIAGFGKAPPSALRAATSRSQVDGEDCSGGTGPSQVDGENS